MVARTLRWRRAHGAADQTALNFGRSYVPSIPAGRPAAAGWPGPLNLSRALPAGRSKCTRGRHGDSVWTPTCRLLPADMPRPLYIACPRASS